MWKVFFTFFTLMSASLESLFPQQEVRLGGLSAAGPTRSTAESSTEMRKGQDNRRCPRSGFSVSL